MILRSTRTLAIGTCALLAGGAALQAGALAAQDAPPEVVYLFADLEGADEPGGGDKNGFGDMAVAVKLTEGKFCYELSVGQIATATAAHVHEGKAGVNGPPVITIAVTGPKNQVCVDAEGKLLRKIAEKPGDYYVNVHTADFPTGAIRGQLQL